MRKKILRIVALVLLTAGIVSLLYRPVSNMSYAKKQDAIIADFNNTFSKESKSKNSRLEKLRNDIQEYNRTLIKNHQDKLGNPEYYGASAIRLSDYGFKSEVYGYLEISKLNLKMAIYLGTSDYNMSLGAAHMAQTSIPYGGKNTNAVIAGHCGFGACDYFRYIETLEKGDKVKVTTPLGSLHYEVSGKKVIEPSDLKSIRIRKNKDMVTLFTCYPYPTSQYRICVFCTADNN